MRGCGPCKTSRPPDGRAVDGTACLAPASVILLFRIIVCCGKTGQFANKSHLQEGRPCARLWDSAERSLFSIRILERAGAFVCLLAAGEFACAYKNLLLPAQIANSAFEEVKTHTRDAWIVCCCCVADIGTTLVVAAHQALAPALRHFVGSLSGSTKKETLHHAAAPWCCY